MSKVPAGATKMCFYGRVSTSDLQSPEESRRWQRSRAEQLIAGHGEIVTEFFDEGQSRTTPWKRRPQATALLAELRNRNRGWSAVVIGEPSRAFAGIEFGLIFPILTHWDVALWVPEVGGAVDPGSEAHELVMSLFSGLSKGERNRIKIRTRSALEAMSATGRFTGGAPAYGYKLIDVGEHPNPKKAGKRLWKLDVDPTAAPIVVEMFQRYAGGEGLGRIADDLTARGVLSPSAHNIEFYPHRRDSHGAWSRSAVRAILTNPVYKGKAVYGRLRRAEILVDNEDAAKGYEVRQRRNDRDKWSVAEEPTHPRIIDDETWKAVDARFLSRQGGRGSKELAKGRRHYPLRGLIRCPTCGRSLEHTTITGYVYAACRMSSRDYSRHPELEATHPKSAYLRVDKLVPIINCWLAQVFDEDRVDETAKLLAQAAAEEGGDEARLAAADEWRRKLMEAQGRVERYREALLAGLDAAIAARFINEAETDARFAEAELARLDPKEPPTADEIKALIARLGNIVARLNQADPKLLNDTYRALGLRVTWAPRAKEVDVQIAPGLPATWGDASSEDESGGGARSAGSLEARVFARARLALAA